MSDNRIAHVVNNRRIREPHTITEGQRELAAARRPFNAAREKARRKQG